MGMFLQMEKIKNVRNSLWSEKVIYRASEKSKYYSLM